MNTSVKVRNESRTAVLGSNFVSNVMKLATGSAIAQAAGMLVAPIVARLFLPEAFGTAALFGSIASIIGVVACMRYEFSIMLPKDDKEAANLFALCLVIVFVLSIVSAIAVAFGKELIVSLVNDQALKTYLWLIPVVVIINGTFLAFNYWNSRTKHFGRQSVAEVVSSVTTQLSKLGAGFAGMCNGGVLIAAGALGQGVAATMLGGKIWKDDRRIFVEGIRWKKMVAGFKRYSKFAKYDIWSGLLNSASWQLPSLLLAAFFTPKIVGYYALGLAVIRLPMTIVGKAIARVFYQRASEANNLGTTGDVVTGVFKRLVSVSLFPLLMLSLIGKDLFTVVFGHNWPEAGIYIQILSPFVFFNFISSPLSTLFSIYERQDSALYLNTVIFITRGVSLYVGGILGNVYLALGLFSLTGVILYGGLALWSLKMSGLKTALFINELLKSILCFAPAGVCLYALKMWYNISPVMYLLIAGIVVLFYEAVVFVRDGTLKLYFKKLTFGRLAKQRQVI